MTEAVLRELDGMRALARSLVHGDPEAEDLLQDAAVAAIEHPPELDRPVRPWLAAVLRNRRRMDRRGEARRRMREAAVAPADVSEADAAPDALDRARTLERLGAALVALDEPYRTTVMRRYFDGRSAADIAREAGVPAGTVRWRLKTGLERLRAALDAREPSWRRALIPLVPGAVVKTKTSFVAAVVVLLLLAAGFVIVWKVRGTDDDKPPVASGGGSGSQIPTLNVKPLPRPDDPAPVHDPLPGQGRARVETLQLAGGSVTGRVINWSTGDGVAGAELTFTTDGNAVTVRSRAEGVFDLAPAAPGQFTLTAISAPGFLPYAPELLHSTVHVDLTRDRAVRGITVFLFPAVDYHGRVVDARKEPVAGARVKLLGTPTGEQAIERLETEWTTDAKGEFTFHAADEAVFEATKGVQRGWGRLDGDVAVTHQLVIAIGDAPARDLTITGRVVDGSGAPLADVLVRANPMERPAKEYQVRATSFATTSADGAFTLEHLDRGTYDLAAHSEGRAPAERENVPGGMRNVTITLDAGVVIAGAVVTSQKEPVPAYTLLVQQRRGTARELVVARSVVDASGRFEVRVQPGEYELLAAASGWAPSAPTPVTAGARDVELVVTAGATLRGTVVAADGSGPLGLARVMREANSGGASAQPANAGTVTRNDGTFELTGIPPGPLSITIAAGGYNPKIEAGMTAVDGETLGPRTFQLAKIAPGEQPHTELVGIGVALTADGDVLRITKVIAGGGAEAAGIIAGDRVVAIDGVAADKLGVDGAVQKIRGVEGTTLSVTVLRGDKPTTLVVQRRKLQT